jgi:hypothetical protein
MANTATHPTALSREERQQFIIESFTRNYADLMTADLRGAANSAKWQKPRSRFTAEVLLCFMLMFHTMWTRF